MIITDQAAYSDQVFGLYWLLGYQFSPRPAALPDQRFWYFARDSDYGAAGPRAQPHQHRERDSRARFAALARPPNGGRRALLRTPVAWRGPARRSTLCATRPS